MKRISDNHNCSICATEFNMDELKSLASSKLNCTSFKICERCVQASNPKDDYLEAKMVASNYLSKKEARILFNQAKEILKEFK